ncbi:MAG: DegV family EDD domain-containing protein [Lachnospiraceae bacterium]|nr:DegV family EDD domain-containing protein [Lachnospiraceae bacterium]
MHFLKNLLKQPQRADRDLQQRLYILLTAMADLALLIILIADILLTEHPLEVIVIALVIVFLPLTCYLSIRLKHEKEGRIIMAFTTIYLVMPVTFFAGGGMQGGAIQWFSFAYLYVGLLLTGAWRFVMLSSLTLLAVFEFFMNRVRPDLIQPHSDMMGQLDILVSVVLVGFVIYILVRFQNNMFLVENQKAREEASKVEEMSRSQNQFFSNMSHEIRTPINTIIGLNEMILREDISDEVAEDAANIRAAGKMLLHLINDILDMSKIQSGQMELSLSTYDPGNMLSEIVGMLWVRAKDKDLDFLVNIAPDLPAELYGDEVRIKQILINVINNAIKYTREGSVTFSVQCGEKNGDEMNIVYSVTDTGIGIKKESIPHLFSAFKRVDEEKNRYIEGTGLGLSIVKQLVDLMGGKIAINSVYTKGSTFVIEIPQKIMSTRELGEIEIEDRRTFRRRDKYRTKFEAPDARLLIVDDNSSNLLVATKLLRDTKIRIDTAKSGEEALKLTLNNEYQVIFMDHLMPEMDGIECRRRILNQTGGRSRNARIVALTANAGEKNRQLYAREGFDSYIEKPVSGDILEQELYHLLPSELVRSMGNAEEFTKETMSWMQSRRQKKAIAISTESVSDLPAELISQYDIKVFAHKVVTEDGSFRDGIEIDTDGLLDYMKDSDHKVETASPTIAEHEAFFADCLTTANNVIHISVSSNVAKSGYLKALEAAKAFGNVFVINSHHLSSGEGLMTLEACRLAREGYSPAEIAEALENYAGKIHTSFVVNEMDFLARAGQISSRVANLSQALMIRPVLVMRKGRLRVGRVFFGSKERAWKRYIDSELTPLLDIDTSILFVTYVGLSNRDKELIRSYIDQRMHFDKIWFRKASPVIAVNCGAGTFGLLYRENLRE